MMSTNIYMCPSVRRLQCSWEGESGNILDHFISEHEDLLLHSSQVFVDLNLSSENYLLFLNEEVYLVQLIIEDDILKIGLRYLGPKYIAEAFTYDIVISVAGENYFMDYFKNSPSIIDIRDGFWFVDLKLLKLLHKGLLELECTFNISTKNIYLQNDIDIVQYQEKQASSSQIEESEGGIINDEEIDDILNCELRQSENKRDYKERDALDNISSLNFSVLEANSRHCRRFSSFIDIPRELFDEKETTNLSCSNCFINMLPPIYLCINNHNVCADCVHEKCKICYERNTDKRNRELEEYSRKCLHLCRYHLEGCVESFMYNEIRNHEIKCEFCTYKCIESCNFSGKFRDFQSHFKINHPSLKIFNSTPVDFPKNSEFLIYQEKLGIFLCIATASENSTRWLVISLGPKDRHYTCELTFKGGKNNKLFLKRLEDKYSIIQEKEDLKKMKVKNKNAVLNIICYFK